MRRKGHVWRAAVGSALLACVAAVPIAGQGTVSTLTQVGQGVVIRGG